MKIIVTGGAGFIGSNIVDGYLKLGHHVTVIDNLSTGLKKNLNPKAKFYKADIRNLSKMHEIFRKEKPVIVNHHAAVAEVVKSLRDPMPTLESNVNGMVNVLLASGSTNVKKVIFSSTGGAIYGKPAKIPADERTPTEPLSPYGLSKLLGEQCVKYYARTYNFEYLIFRYPNVYGPKQNPLGEAGVVAIFAGLMMAGKRPTIFGDGTKTRDYVYVEDIVRANVIALNKGKNEILNLGWGKEISDQTVYDTLAKNLSFSKPPRYKPFRSGEVHRIALNATKAIEDISWQPKLTLEDGVRKYLATLE